MKLVILIPRNPHLSVYGYGLRHEESELAKIFSLNEFAAGPRRFHANEDG